jgi:hypothetical protein
MPGVWVQVLPGLPNNHMHKPIEPTGQMDMDICQCENIVAKVRARDDYAQNLYAAMCNRDWQYQDVWTLLTGKTWSCSWRSAGAIVADIRGEGDYMDWYCSGMSAWNLDGNTVDGAVAESVVTAEIRCDLADIGWQPLDCID